MQSIIFIMGVSGSGKTTVGKLLHEQTGFPFFDADDFHPAANIEKMKAGVPLTDDDRAGWLRTLNALAKVHVAAGAIIACSALKLKYREQLAQGLQQVQWIYLKGTYEMIYERMQQRKVHYFSAAMLQSQFDILEEPEEAWHYDVKDEPGQIVSYILKQTFMKSAFGVIGLGVMGKSLAMNLAGKGVTLSLYNRFVKDKEEQVAEKIIAANPELHDSKGFENINAFVQSLIAPRKILLMVNAGAATDAVIEQLMPLLGENDIVIDGGNSFYKDTEQRINLLKAKGIQFIGAGISGGEEGALKGPSIMPGGDKNAYQQVQTVLESIAAMDKNGKACCAYIGPGGSGHFVKMVHNAIEYAEMQLLSEVYDLMRNGLQLSPDAIAEKFTEWNASNLNSYLLEITIAILHEKENGDFLIDKILDTGSSKGTGSWAVATAAELGVPAGMMTAALNARYLSINKNLRVTLQQSLNHEKSSVAFSIDELKAAYTLARIINHHQGFELIKAAALKYEWAFNYNELARIWTNGCIIRSQLMEQLSSILSTDTLLLHPAIVKDMLLYKSALQSTVAQALQQGFSIPVMSEALNYLHATATANSAMNIIQAQRDYFGAHTYQRIDDASGKAYHKEWNKQ